MSKVSKTSMTSPPTMNEEEDLATLIYTTSKTAKARAAAAGKEKGRKSQKNASTLVRRTSTRKRSFVSHDDESWTGRPRKKRSVGRAKKVCSELGRKEAVKKKYWYGCSAAGCTNQAQTGGLCSRHGAKRTRCSIDGCTKYAQKGGVCKRHGAKVKVKLCSSEGCTNLAVKGGVCVRHGHRLKHAAEKDARVKLRKEECASGMGPAGKYAEEKDAQIMSSKEECVLNMGLRRSAVAVQVATIELRKEECALDMGQRSNYAAVQDAQIKPKEEECVGSMGQTALLTTHPLLLEQNSTRPGHLPVYPICAILLRCHMNEVPVCLQKY